MITACNPPEELANFCHFHYIRPPMTGTIVAEAGTGTKPAR
jgi:hypothetical protein